MEARIETGQNARIGRAYRSGRGCRIKLHPKCTEGSSCCVPGTLELSPNQDKKLKSSDGHVSIPFKHTELRRNGTVQGGFIPLIIAALASSVPGGLVERAVAGAGLVWRHKDRNWRVKHTGNGLLISPWKGTLTGGNGFYHHHRGVIRPANVQDIKKIPLSGRRVIQSLF